eukprot:GGOE01062809.1.p2 GENE.GGOE01062809.1~~GGOE01062809.1.p2  ORF type:complete len:286 (+),score=14.94 GGOE01062809.1:507-1364(+)
MFLFRPTLGTPASRHGPTLHTGDVNCAPSPHTLAATVQQHLQDGVLPPDPSNDERTPPYLACLVVDGTHSAAQRSETCTAWVDRITERYGFHRGDDTQRVLVCVGVYALGWAEGWAAMRVAWGSANVKSNNNNTEWWADERLLATYRATGVCPWADAGDWNIVQHPEPRASLSRLVVAMVPKHHLGDARSRDRWGGPHDAVPFAPYWRWLDFRTVLIVTVQGWMRMEDRCGIHISAAAATGASSALAPDIHLHYLPMSEHSPETALNDFIAALGPGSILQRDGRR